MQELDYKVPNGKLVRLRARIDGNEIAEIKITGDFFLHPEDKIVKLEAALTGKELEKVTLQKTAEDTLKGCEMIGISPEEIANAIMKLK
jgi:lipoate-protein ligase A